MFNVIDSKTGAVIGTYPTLRRAHMSADRKNKAHGSYRYLIKEA
jgi:hypothetical protein